MGYKPKSDSRARKKRKYNANLRRAFVSAVDKTCQISDRPQDHNPGVGWEMEVKDGYLYCRIDLSKSNEKYVTKTGKGYMIGHTAGRYTLAKWGYPDHFVIMNCWRRRDIHERVEVDAIRQYIQKCEKELEEKLDAQWQAFHDKMQKSEDEMEALGSGGHPPIQPELRDVGSEGDVSGDQERS